MRKRIKFKTTESAIEYAENNIGKYDCIIAEIEEKPAILSATSLPLEEMFRDPIEEIVRSLLTELEYGNEDDIEDIALYIGAEISGKLMDMIEEEANVIIASAYQEF